MDGLRLPLHLQQRLGRGDLPHLRQRVVLLTVAEDIDLTFKIGIAHFQPHHEAVELSLRQELRARRADGVLRGDDGEGHGQRMRHAVHRDLPLLHDLQKRCLRLAGGTVDLVGQQKIRHDRAGLIDEGPAFLAVNGEADNIRGQHVGRELDAAVTQAERAVEGQRSRRFAGAGDVVQQHMTAGDQRHENLFSITSSLPTMTLCTSARI